MLFFQSLKKRQKTVGRKSNVKRNKGKGGGKEKHERGGGERKEGIIMRLDV